MTKQEFINKYIYGIGNDALTDNQEAIDMSNDLDKYVTEQLRQYNVSGRSEQLAVCEKCGSSKLYQITKLLDKCDDCGNIQDC